MAIHAEYQIIYNHSGLPEYVLVPYDVFLQLTSHSKINLGNDVSSEVFDLLFDKQYSAVRAWREYLGLTQKECANKLGISQSDYSHLESLKRPRKAEGIKLATALAISESLLDLVP